MKKPVLAVDIDGVINDFHTPFVKFTNKKLGAKHKVKDFYSHNFHQKMGISVEESIRLLNEFEKTYFPGDHILIDGSVETLHELEKHYKIISITGRRDDLKAVTIEFMKNHLPFVEVYFAAGRNNVDSPLDRKHKPKFAEDLGAKHLIDDNEHEFQQWDSEIVKPICFEQPWNKVLADSHPHVPRMQWKGIKKHLMDDLVRVK